MTNKDTVDELVKANSAMTKSIGILTDTNARLTKKVEAQAAELQKRQSKGGGGGGGDAAGAPGGNEGSYCKNCKRTTWHLPDNYFELEKNKSKRPAYWKSAL